MAGRKKKVIPRKPKTGFLAAPTETFEAFNAYVRTDVEQSEIVKTIKDYLKKNLTKDQKAAIAECPEWVFKRHNVASSIFWKETLGYEFAPRYVERKVVPNDGDPYIVQDEYFYDGNRVIRNFIKDAVERGEAIIEEKKKNPQAKAKKEQVSPQILMARKVKTTILADIEDWVEDFADGKSEKDYVIADALKIHAIPNAAINQVKADLELYLDDFGSAYNKTDEQAVEGYSHIPRVRLRKLVKALEKAIADCDMAQSTAKATRKPRKPKEKAADKQVKTLKFKGEDSDYNIKSINPIYIVGSMRMYVFNTKTRELFEYVSDNPKGFAVKGTTLQQFDEELSRKVRLRKPEDFLLTVLKKTPNQIGKEWDKLTTKTGKANGRINAECVLLRVLDK